MRRIGRLENQLEDQLEDRLRGRLGDWLLRLRLGGWLRYHLEDRLDTQVVQPVEEDLCDE